MALWEFIPMDALDKLLPGAQARPFTEPDLPGYAGKAVYLQLAYRGEGFFCLTLEGQASMRVSAVENVPCRYPCHESGDDNYLTTQPGSYPDLLRPVQGNRIEAGQELRTLFLALTAPEGVHNLTLHCIPEAGEAVSIPVRLRIAPPLPPQRVEHTQWFHADCLADYYGVEPFSEAHWAILDRFFASFVSHGCTMILTPVFTPPLDTQVGGERTTVQLVDVEAAGETYRFGFDRLDRWIRLCAKHGIRGLEICHLFTQWGAAAAPKIMGLRDGKYTRLFGWDTPSVGGPYTTFLRSFLPALKEHLRELGWLERTWFHISDEPGPNELPAFAAARNSIADLLTDCRCLDATGSYDLYRQGLIRIPVVSEDDLPAFLTDRPPHLWTYYCTAQWRRVPNRFIAMPSARGRILGALLWHYHLEGFLQWGFNFYNSALSKAHIDPFGDTDSGGAFPSGDPFLVYPGPDGEPWESLRGITTRDAFLDCRALEALERRVGREAAAALLESLTGPDFSFTSYPRDNAFFYALRRRIAEYL